ncbi:MAG: glyoxalase [Pseudozobellia sp.]|nr:glyoxalase [Pseudozobellia sp.]MBG47881.1 glyoxalase [Pseudozobellia sp.]|tara:strand:- start:41 stop:433 length:393 start_codon:yes stop_codon:yes gene_type:complete
MLKIDPIIAVKDVNASAEWYMTVIGCQRAHGGDEFAVLVDKKSGDTLLCLHKWGAHEHPTMMNPKTTVGNGLILYLKTDRLEEVLANVEKIGHPIQENLHLNTNSNQMEFSVLDPDGYYLTITEYHRYEG